MFFFDIGYPKPYEYKLLMVYFLATGIATSFILGLPFVIVDPQFICFNTDVNENTEPFKCAVSDVCSGDYAYQIDTVNSADSIVLEYGLYCDRRYIADLIGSFTFLGQFLGYLLYTFFYDNQKDAFTTAVRTIFYAGFFALLTTISWNPFVYMFFRFVFSMFYSGLNVLAYSHLVEMTSYNPVFMNFCIIMLNISWGVGQTYIGFLCALYFNWRWSLPLYDGIPLIILSFYFWTLKVEQEDYDEIREGELAMVRIHHKKQNTATHNNISKVFAYKSIRQKLVFSTVIYLLINLCYFGTVFSIGSLGGSIYLDMILMSMFEVMSYVISGYITPNCRRKTALIVIFFINFCIFFYFLWVNVDALDNIKNSTELVNIALALVGRFFICSSYMFFYVYYAELMPKSVIRTTFGMANICFTVGLAYMPEMLSELKAIDLSPFFSFSIINLAAFFLMFLLPETLGNEVHEITEEERQAERNVPLLEMGNIKAANSAKIIRGQ